MLSLGWRYSELGVILKARTTEPHITLFLLGLYFAAAMPPPGWKQNLEHAALTDVGLRRGNNQDNYCVFLANSEQDFAARGHLFIVADGMGAHAAGELASKIAVDTIPLAYHKLRDKQPAEALLEAVTETNAQIHSRGMASPEFRGMGTTCSVLALLEEGALLAHVGDSRVYRVRGANLAQMTFDHSLVWELRANGQNFDRQFPNFVSKNIITRSLGPHPKVQVDIEGPHPVEPGDAFLLCSDGLSGQVEDYEIGAVVKCLPPKEAAQALIDLANLRGGPDNITVVIAKIPQPKPETEEEASRKKSVGSASLPFWIAAGASLVISGVFAALQIWPAVVVGAAIAAISGIVAVARRPGEKLPPPAPGVRYGRGPYVNCKCEPNAQWLAKLDEMIAQVKSAADADNWVISWEPFDDRLRKAAEAEKVKDISTAAAERLRAISYAMREIQRQGDSSSRSPKK